MSSALLLINGQLPKQLPNLDHYAVVACTDGAYRYFLEHPKERCDYIIGDLDSLPQFTKQNTSPCVIQTPDQNKTDFEKALLFLLSKQITHINVYGASGREQDHFLGNLSVALQFQHQLAITFYDDYQYYFLAKQQTLLNNVKGRTISLIPLPNAENVTTQGLAYPINNQTLSFGQWMSLRNVAVDDSVTVTYCQGALFIFVEIN